MSSFLSAASKRVGDVREFLRSAAGGDSIKYVAEKGAKHVIYIPAVATQIEDENGNSTVVQELCSIQGSLHEWTTADNKFKATVCQKGVVYKDENGEVINDGSCPFCDRITDAWDIFNYRYQLEENNCKLTGDQRAKHLENAKKSFVDERKAKDARPYLYILVAKFRTDSNSREVLGSDGLPEYELKVMKMSAKKVEKIQQQVMNSGLTLPGSELIIEYPNVEDRRLLVSQSTTTVVFPNNALTARYPAVVNKINEDVSRFKWEGIEKSFSEWAGMTTVEAKAVTSSMFEQWDKYKLEMKTNPQAKYLEYVVQTPTAKPSLGDGEVNVAPVVPNVPGANPGAAVQNDTPIMPSMAGGIPVPTVPPMAATATAPAPSTPGAAIDPNAVFSGAMPVPPTPSVQM